MTADEIEAMEPGYELDAMVGKAIGWEPRLYVAAVNKKDGRVELWDSRGGVERFCARHPDYEAQEMEGWPQFSEHIEDAMGIQKKMEERGFWLSLKSHFCPGQPWWAGFTPHNCSGWSGRPDNAAPGRTAAESIVKAALLVLHELPTL